MEGLGAEWRGRGKDEGKGEIWRDWERSGEGEGTMKGKERFGGTGSGVEKEGER